MLSDAPTRTQAHVNTIYGYILIPPSFPCSGKTVTIINRSEIVGRPLAAMLANDGATIYSIDVDSIFMFKRGALRKTEATPEEAVGQSDVVVTVSASVVCTVDRIANLLECCVRARVFVRASVCGCVGFVTVYRSVVKTG